MHLFSMSAEIYEFVLANQVNANKIMIFFTTIFCSLKAPMKALIGFGRCYIPSADSLSCPELKSVCTILMPQLWANSWKYTCLRMMDCLHHVTATWKVLKRLNALTIWPPTQHHSACRICGIHIIYKQCIFFKLVSFHHFVKVGGCRKQ